MRKLLPFIFLCLILELHTYAQTFTITIPGNPLDTSGWTARGNIVGDVFELTPPLGDQTGYIYNRTPRNLTNCAQFTVDFDFRITEGSNPIADGIAFWYITNPPVGSISGGGIGLPSKPNGFVFIMDTYKNTSGTYTMPIVTLRMMDGTYDYIENDPVGRLIPDLTNQQFIVNGQWHNCKIHYLYGNIDVSFDNGPIVMTAYQPLNITGYFGFSSSTGGSWSRQAIRNIKITGAPNPAPAAPVVRDTAYCFNQPAAPLTATGTNLKWYTSPTGTTPLPGPPTPNTSVPGVYRWYVTQEITGCGIFSAQSVVTVTVHSPVVANFSDSVKLTCGRQDTVVLIDSSIGSGLHYKWDFGDGAGDTAQNPTHIYTQAGAHSIKLRVNDGLCSDSMTKAVSTLTPLKAAFGVSKDSICQHSMITFSDSSTGTNISRYWYFADGSAIDSTAVNPMHTYDSAGVFTAMLVVKDAVPCYDTAYHTIVSDSLPHASIALTDSSICVGQDVGFIAKYTIDGLENIIWDFGDGNIVKDTSFVHHAYSSSNTFYITFTANYRLCPDTTIKEKVIMYPFPMVNIGPDTALCPGEGSLTFTNQSYNDPSYTHIWSNGDRASGQITVNQPGTYWLEVSTPGGCIAADTVVVNPSCYIAIPNAFTPNGDGVNDYFFPRQLLSRAIRSFHMSIYNRWGQLIFESINADGRGWDGKYNDAVQAEGAYIYLIDVTFRNGVSEKYKGNITLLH